MHANEQAYFIPSSFSLVWFLICFLATLAKSRTATLLGFEMVSFLIGEALITHTVKMTQAQIQLMLIDFRLQVAKHSRSLWLQNPANHAIYHCRQVSDTHY